jgi:hypothetical protein
MLVCAIVLDGDPAVSLRRGRTARCQACAANGSLLSGLRRAVKAQAALSGKLPHPNASVTQQLATPGRAAQALWAKSEQLRAVSGYARIELGLHARHKEMLEEEGSALIRARRSTWAWVEDFYNDCEESKPRWVT